MKVLSFLLSFKDSMPPNKPPTIYDVARHAGVSIATVSRMINTPNKVNGDTRVRILAAIDALGFVPKAEARARAMRGTGRIGVISPFFTAPSFVQRLRGIAEALSTKKFELVIYTVDSAERLKSLLSSVPLTGNLDGLIILSLSVGDAEARRLVEHGPPTVLIEFPHPSLSSVEIDDEMGGRMAAKYLLKKGHRRIAFLGDTDLPEYSLILSVSAWSGFVSVCKRLGSNSLMHLYVSPLIRKNKPARLPWNYSACPSHRPPYLLQRIFRPWAC